MFQNIINTIAKYFMNLTLIFFLSIRSISFEHTLFFSEFITKYESLDAI